MLSKDLLRKEINTRLSNRLGLSLTVAPLTGKVSVVSEELEVPRS